MDVKNIFISVKRKEYWYWAILMTAMVLHLYPGGRQFFGLHFWSSSVEKGMGDLQSILWHHVTTLLFLGLPLLLLPSMKVFRHSISLFCPGDWRWGIKWTSIGCLVVILPIWFSSFSSEFLSEYPHSEAILDSLGISIIYLISYLLYYIGWESFFRGYIGFGMTGLGYAPFLALMVQVSLSTIIHLGKPQLELISAIPGGIYMGILAYRSRSILWPMLFHFFVGIFNTIFCWMHQ